MVDFPDPEEPTINVVSLAGIKIDIESNAGAGEEEDG